MAVLEKIRVKMGAFITVLIGLALLSFIIDPATLETAVSMFSSKYDVGEMNGKSVSYQDYQKRIDYYTEIYQMTSGGAASDDKVQEMINQSAWQYFIDQNVILPAIDAAGIKVGKDEMYDLAQGNNISPVLLNEPTFLDQNGSFDRARVAEFINAASQDETGRLDMYWSFIENNMLSNQLLTKYTSLFEKSSILNPVELAREIDNNNVTSAVEFVMKPIGFAQDSTIKVSDGDIRKYYDEHKDNYKRGASRDIDYVVYEVVPSEKDFEMAKADIDKIFPDFQAAKNLKAFLTRNSDEQLNPYYYKEGELSSDLDKFAFSSTMEDVLPVYQDGDSYKAARISDIKMMSDSIFVSHILLQGMDEAAVNAQADSLINLLDNGKADFSQLASQYSADKSMRTGVPGELGWLTQTYMLPGFESLLYAPLDKNMKLKTDYGVHIVKVTDRTKPVKKVQLAILTKDVVASKATFQDYYTKANDLASRCEGKAENFNRIAKEENLQVYPATGIVDGAKTVATYENARELSRWAYEAKVGDVSPIITVNNQYFFVASLTAIKEEGYAPVNEVAPQIRMILTNRMKGEKLAAEVKTEIEGLSTMEEIAQKLGTTVSKQDAISFGAYSSRSFDPAFVGAVAGAPENQITGPVIGNVGVYVFNVTGRETGAFYSEDDAVMRRAQAVQFQLRMLPSVLNDMADIKDTRAKFF